MGNEYEDHTHGAPGISRLVERLGEYRPENPEDRMLLAADILGINGKSFARTQETIDQLKTLANVRSESLYSTIDWLFHGDPSPDEVVSRLNTSNSVYLETIGNPYTFSLPKRKMVKRIIPYFGRKQKREAVPIRFK